MINARSKVFGRVDAIRGFRLDAELYVRYRYRGIGLFHLRYSDYHKYLRNYLQAVDILPLLKRGDSYRVQILRSGPPRWVPAADPLHQDSLHRRAGHVLPLGQGLYRRFIFGAVLDQRLDLAPIT